MTGGDVAPLGKDAVTEIHKVFDWANSTSKGVVLFIDEADAFLRKRSTEKISEDLRNALNAFLYRTGESSKTIMLVYASNQPEQFDWAINDRIDEIVFFTLPDYPERLRMITQFIDQNILNSKPGSKKITVVGLDKELLERIAKETENYSGREISKLVIAFQAAAYANMNAVLDSELVLEILRDNKLSKLKKIQWLREEESKKMTQNA
jgi:ATPase family AAA domain-containing protein 3A/B